MELIDANQQDALIIEQLAKEIWHQTYADILSKNQIDFMLADMYSPAALAKQMQSGHQFLILKSDSFFQGFASFSASESTKVYKIHKFYIRKEMQGKGAGKFMLAAIEKRALNAGSEILELNVNRGNPAKVFYQKMGFSIFEEVDIPYHQFVLDDFVMQKKLL